MSHSFSGKKCRHYLPKTVAMGSFCKGMTGIRTCFQVFDYLFGIVLIAYAVIYTILFTLDLKKVDYWPPGAKIAQISFCVALFGKGIGIFLTAITISANWMFDSLSLFTNGLPGYIIAASYCFIFFSWCSVCTSSFGNEAKGFFVHSQKVLASLLIFICLGFIVAVILMLSMTDKSASFHKAEAIVASFRDLAIAIAFGFYLYHVQKLFDTNCLSLKNPESRLFFMCIILMIALLFRCVSIQVYTWYYSNSTGRGYECTTKYFVNFIFDQFISELIPLGFIGIQRHFQDANSNAKVKSLESTLA